MILKLILLIILVPFIYLFIKKPFTLAAVLLFMLLYGFNLKLPFLFDARGILLILMIGRLLIEKENLNLISKYFFTDKYFYLFMGFIFYSMAILIPRFYDIKDFDLIKNNLILIGSFFLGFMVSIHPKGKNVFIIAIMTSGIFATIDLIYTYIVFGDNSPVRVLNVILYNDPTQINYNYHAMLIGIAIIYTLLLYHRKTISKIISFILLFTFTLGVILTTSRGAITSIILVYIIMVIVQKEIKINLRTIITGSVVLLVFFVSFYMVYNVILSDVKRPVLIDNIYWRLYQEPLGLLGISTSDEHVYSVDVKYGTMSQRYEKSSEDINNFLKSSFLDQTFGLGEDGYIFTKFSSDDWRNAHNGYVLLLIERGILGSVLFLVSLVMIIVKSLKISRKTTTSIPIVYLLLFLAVFTVSHNGEITSNLAFLIFGGIIGNNKRTLIKTASLSNFLKNILLNSRIEEKETDNEKNNIIVQNH